MKTTITAILFLISMVGVGQKPIDHKIILNDDGDTVGVYLTEDKILVKPNYIPKINSTISARSDYGDIPTRAIRAIVDHWKQYKQECFNDSTVRYYWTFSDMGVTWTEPCDPNIENNFMPCQRHTSHKQPTFEGFMDWLERRQK